MAEEFKADSDQKMQKMQNIHKYVYVFYMQLQFGINVFTGWDLNPGLFQNNLCKFDQI